MNIRAQLKDSPRMRIVFFIFALVLAVSTFFGIARSVILIRDSVAFSRLVGTLRREGANAAEIEAAAEFARRPGEWQQLLQLAWELPDDQRWRTLAALGRGAAARFARDPQWPQITVYALVRSGEHAAARSILAEIRDQSELTQELAVLAAADPDDRADAPVHLTELSDRYGPESLAGSVGIAISAPTYANRMEAWSRTRISAFAINAALESAAAGNRAESRAALDAIQSVMVLPDPGRTAASLYLALWLGELDWFFAQLQRMDRRAATAPELLLLQADALLQQGQRMRARAVYEEIIAVAPEISPTPHLNAAVLQRAERPEVGIATLQGAIERFPADAELRRYLAAAYHEAGDPLSAMLTLAPVITGSTGGSDDPLEGDHARWLFVRTVLGRRSPISRTESDLWNYLNRYPDADLVAQFLARFLSIRNDSAGLSQLVRRYESDGYPWVRTAQAMLAIDRDELAMAERHLNEARTTDAASAARSIRDEYVLHRNASLFALRYLPLDEAETHVSAFRRWSERFLPQETEPLMHSAELLRLRGDLVAARELVDRAIAISPDTESLYTFRAILARP